MKFKVYGWNGFYKDEDGEYSSTSFNATPSVRFDTDAHDFPPDKSFPRRRKGRNFFLLFAWLFWGVTLDLRTGTDSDGDE
jgi:hypothetical protein